MKMRTSLTPKQITKLNSDYLRYKQDNPDTLRSFESFKQEFFLKRFNEDIERAKKEHRKVRELQRKQKQKTSKIL